MIAASRRQDDDGFTLIEVIIAIFILAIVLTATTAVLINGFRSVRDNIDRVYAANIARTEIQRLETIDPLAIPVGLTVRKEATDIGSYDVRTTAQWTALGATENICSSSEIGQAYLAVHVTVTGGRLQVPEESSTVITPDIAVKEPDKGFLLVKVLDQDGEPVPEVLIEGVNLLEESDTVSALTSDGGCVLFPGLANQSNWRLTASRDGWVSPENSLTPTIVAGVTAGETSQVGFTMGQGGYLTAQAFDPEYPIPSDIRNFWMESTFIQKTLRDTSGNWPHDEGPLYPVSSGYQLTMGPCSPIAQEDLAQRFNIVSGEYSTAGLNGVMLEIKGVEPLTQIRATRVADPIGDCTQDINLDLGFSDITGGTKVALPFGDWIIKPQGAVAETFSAPEQIEPVLKTLDWGL